MKNEIALDHLLVKYVAFVHIAKLLMSNFPFKYHSLSLRRQVKDRSKPFDELLELHREQKRGKASSQTPNSQPTIIAQTTATRCLAQNHLEYLHNVCILAYFI